MNDSIRHKQQGVVVKLGLALHKGIPKHSGHMVMIPTQYAHCNLPQQLQKNTEGTACLARESL